MRQFKITINFYEPEVGAFPEINGIEINSEESWQQFLETYQPTEEELQYILNEYNRLVKQDMIESGFVRIRKGVIAYQYLDLEALMNTGETSYICVGEQEV